MSSPSLPADEGDEVCTPSPAGLSLDTVESFDAEPRNDVDTAQAPFPAPAHANGDGRPHVAEAVQESFAFEEPAPSVADGREPAHETAADATVIPFPSDTPEQQPVDQPEFEAADADLPDRLLMDEPDGGHAPDEQTAEPAAELATDAAIQRSLRLTERVQAAQEGPPVFESQDPEARGAPDGRPEPAETIVITFPRGDWQYTPPLAPAAAPDAAAPDGGAEPGAAGAGPQPSHAADVPAESGPATAQAAALSPPTREPLANAYDAAAKLAEDAVAASDAIESIKRLLQMQLSQQQGSGRTPEASLEASNLVRGLAQELARGQGQAAATEPRTGNAPPAAALPLPLPPPLPVGRDAPVSPPQPLVLSPPMRSRRSRGGAVRGFLAGFALSWVVGAALFLYLNAG